MSLNTIRRDGERAVPHKMAAVTIAMIALGAGLFEPVTPKASRSDVSSPAQESRAEMAANAKALVHAAGHTLDLAYDAGLRASQGVADRFDAGAEAISVALETAWRDARNETALRFGPMRLMVPARSAPFRVERNGYQPTRRASKPEASGDLGERRIKIGVQASSRMETSAKPRQTAIYFNFASADISAEAGAALLQEVASLSRLSGPLSETVTLQISGHADAAGPSQVNLALSRERAEATKRFLADRLGDGVRFEVQAFGETALATQTPDGVREARNRRVEIVLR